VRLGEFWFDRQTQNQAERTTNTEDLQRVKTESVLTVCLNEERLNIVHDLAWLERLKKSGFGN
jgi:hypothetical protein